MSREPLPSKGTNRWQTLLQVIGLSPRLNLEFTVITLFCVILPLIVLAELQFNYFRQSQKDFSLAELIGGANVLEGYLFEYKGLLRNTASLVATALPTSHNARPEAMRLLTQSLVNSRSSFAVVVDGHGRLAFGIAQVLAGSSTTKLPNYYSSKLPGLGFLDDFSKTLPQKNDNPTEALSAARYSLVPVSEGCPLTELASVDFSAHHTNFIQLSKQTVDCLGLSSQLLIERHRSLPALVLVAVEAVSDSETGQTIYVLQGLLLNQLNILPQFFTDHFGAGFVSLYAGDTVVATNFKDEQHRLMLGRKVPAKTIEDCLVNGSASMQLFSQGGRTHTEFFLPILSGDGPDAKPVGLISTINLGTLDHELDLVHRDLLLVLVGAVLLVLIVRLPFTNRLIQLARQERDTALLQERYRLAEEIHDAFLSYLSELDLQLKFARRMLADDIEQAYAHIIKATDIARRCTREVRKVIWLLQPEVMYGLELAAKVSEATQMAQNSGIAVLSHCDSLDVLLPFNYANNVLRIAQQAINNAVQHSGASTLEVELTIENDILRLTIVDNGRGLDRNEIGKEDTGFGMFSMTRRAERIFGKIEIESGPDSGTRLTLTAPVARIPNNATLKTQSAETS